MSSIKYMTCMRATSKARHYSGETIEDTGKIVTGASWALAYPERQRDALRLTLRIRYQCRKNVNQAKGIVVDSGGYWVSVPWHRVSGGTQTTDCYILGRP